jgi:hypothetical protein
VLLERVAPQHSRAAEPQGASRFLDELLAEPRLVPADPAVEKGFLRKRYGCPACGAALDTHGASRVEAERALRFDGLAPVGVHVDLPAYHCAACGHDSVEPMDTMVNDLMKASAHAFRAAHIGPG